MSADDAPDALAPDADPTPHATDYSTRSRSTPTRQTAAYWSMTRTMADLS
jgi:hypothetical protein